MPSGDSVPLQWGQLGAREKLERVSHVAYLDISDRMTIALMWTADDLTVAGVAATMTPDPDRVIGRRIARNNALRQVARVREKLADWRPE